MNIKKTWIDTYFNVAHEFAKLSHAVRKKVGCIIVKDDRIISIGVNGTPPGFDNVCEYTDDNGNLVTKLETLHAESNSLCKLAKSTESGLNASLFVTYSPCIECAKLIIQSGIKEVYYDEEYRITDGLDLLKKAGIPVYKRDEIK